MDEMGKKAAVPMKTAKKTTKAAAHAAPAPVAAKAIKKPVAAKPKAASRSAAKTKISHEAIAMLAHRYWAERGGQHGSHEDDWYRAEQELLGKAS